MQEIRDRSEDSPNQRHQIGEKLVKQADRNRGLQTPVEGTSLAGGPAGTGGGARRQRPLHVVGVEHGGAVVGETLAQLAEGDGEGGPGNAAADAAQGVHLLLGGLVVVVEVLGAVRVGELVDLLDVDRAVARLGLHGRPQDRGGGDGGFGDLRRVKGVGIHGRTGQDRTGQEFLVPIPRYGITPRGDGWLASL